MSLISRLSNGWKISMSSFKILQENKQLILFPILSGASMIVLTASFVIAAVFANETLSSLFDEESRALYYLLIFGFYLINYFIVVFFNMALMHCVSLYFKGEEVNLRDGLNFSMSRIGVIFAWSVVAGTVGAILKVIQEETGLIGKIITGLIGVVWNVATFFVVPVLAYENVGPLDAFKRSAAIMKDKWGESVGANFSLGLVQLLALLVTALPLYFLGALINVAVGVILAIFAALLVIAIISAAQNIFISAVYHRLQGEDIAGIGNASFDDIFVYRK